MSDVVRFRFPGVSPGYILSVSPSDPTLAELLEAVDRLGESGFHEVEIRIGRARVRVSRGASATVVAAPPPQLAVAPSGAAAADAADADAGLVIVEAPMVGTFYRRPQPEADPFVEVGDRVREGQVLCIIEAMKLMNNIVAECAGEIVEIAPSDASPVQFGDRLLAIRPN